MASKRPLVWYDDTKRTEELRAGDTLAGVSGSGAILKSTTILLVPYNSIYFKTVIIDVDVTAATKIVVQWGNVADTDENSPEMDEVEFLAIPGTGSFELRMFVNDRCSRLGGTYKINYLIQ